MSHRLIFTLLLTLGMSSCLNHKQQEAQAFIRLDLRPLNSRLTGLNAYTARAFETFSMLANLQLIKLQPPIPEPDEFGLDPNSMLIEAFEIASNYNNSSSILSKIAVELAKVGRRKQALEVFEKAIEEISYDFENGEIPRDLREDKMGEIAIDLAKAGEIDYGLEIARELIEAERGVEVIDLENEVDVILAIATEAYERGDARLAEELTSEALMVAEDVPELIVSHSTSYDEINDSLSAIAVTYARINHIEKALEIACKVGNDYNMYSRLVSDYRGDAYRGILPLINDVEKVYSIFEHEETNLNELTGDGYSILASIAVQLFKLGDEEKPFEIIELVRWKEPEADEYSATARSIHAKNRILSEIAIHLVELGRLEEAIQISEKILSEPITIGSHSFGSDFYIYKSLALIKIGDSLNRAERAEEAFEFFVNAFNLARQISSLLNISGLYRRDIAVALAKVGQVEMAIQYIEGSYAQFPSQKDIVDKGLIGQLVEMEQFKQIETILEDSHQEPFKAKLIVDIISQLPIHQKMDLNLSEVLN